MRDPTDFSQFSLQVVPVEQVRAQACHARRQRRGAARQSVDLRAWEGGPMKGGGSAAHAVDTGNQDGVLRGHFSSLLFDCEISSQL
jgi:hypothetical protein